jgi:homospermidine synthase
MNKELKTNNKSYSVNKDSYIRNNLDINGKYVFKKYDSKEKRKQKFDEILNKKIIFNNKIYFIGFGSVGRPLFWILLKMLVIDIKNITIIDERDINMELNKLCPNNKGISIIKKRLNQYNYLQLLKNLSFNDLIIDVADNISTIDIMKLSQERGCNYISSCIQEWNKFEVYGTKKLFNDFSIRETHKRINEFNKTIVNKNFNGIVSMGCNPGNVSLWTKFGLLKIAKERNTSITNKEYNLLAKELGVQTIHISEKDTQRTNNPKKLGEYCNTWSMTVDSYYGEGLSCLEISWGTHEPKIKDEFIKSEIINNDEDFLICSKIGIYSYAQSWVPICGRYVGNLIPHDESNTIGEFLTIKNNGHMEYKPSVYYVYHASNDAMLSVDEFKQNNEVKQDNYRLLTDEITDGRDILGLTYYLKDKSSYWIGSLLSIHESRDLFNHEIDEFINATNVQVVAGYLSGILYFIDLGNEKKGKMSPDDLPEYLITYQLPFLGEFIFDKKDNFKLSVIENDKTKSIEETNDWTFKNFLVKY